MTTLGKLQRRGGNSLFALKKGGGGNKAIRGGHKKKKGLKGGQQAASWSIATPGWGQSPVERERRGVRSKTKRVCEPKRKSTRRRAADCLGIFSEIRGKEKGTGSITTHKDV